MILFGERFPKFYFEDLHSYIKRGGTVVFPEGGAPLYYDWNLETNEIVGIGKKYYKQLHIGCMFTWDAEAKQLNIKKMHMVKAKMNLSSNYSWSKDELSGPRYLTEINLQGNDRVIPILEGSDGNYSGLVAACYKLNSDLKGNIIIQTRTNNSNRISQSLQAVRAPRLYLLSYAMGVDKVFTYCLRDRLSAYGYGILDSQNREKPVCQVLRTLSEKLPSGSSRPQVREYKNQYIASWVTPAGKKLYCVWSSWIGQKSNIIVKGHAQYYDENGRRLQKKDFYVSPSVTYIEGATSVVFIN
jgi:hypothetical protein